jgi:hypothetical protein
LNPTPRLRDLRQRREKEQDWLNYASWIAIGSAAISGVWLILLALEVENGLQLVMPLVGTTVAQGIVGFKVRNPFSYAAWGLFGFFALGVAYSYFIGTFTYGIVWKSFVGFMYVRAIVATINYRDLTDAINARAGEDTALWSDSVPGT